MEDTKNKIGFNEELCKDVYNFLIDLRNSGTINMFGASPYIQDEFDLDKYISRELLNRFMNGSLIK